MTPTQRTSFLDVKQKLRAAIDAADIPESLLNVLSSFRSRVHADFIATSEEEKSPTSYGFNPFVEATVANRQFHNMQDVVDWCNHWGVVLPKTERWWSLQPLDNPSPRTGRILGVPHSWGIPRITNGIVFYVERPDGTLLLGHRDWLKWDPRRRNTEGRDNDGNKEEVECSTSSRRNKEGTKPGASGSPGRPSRPSYTFADLMAEVGED